MDMLVVVSCSIPEKHGCVADMGTRAHLQTGRGDQSVYNWGNPSGQNQSYQHGYGLTSEISWIDILNQQYIYRH